MNQVELLRAVLSCVFPKAQITLEKPLHENGFWSMDVRLPIGYHLAIDWHRPAALDSPGMLSMATANPRTNTIKTLRPL